MSSERPLFGSYSDTSAINIKNMVTDLFGQMRDPSPGVPSPRSSTGSLVNAAVTKNVGFLTQNSSEHLPWSGSAVAFATNCNNNLNNESAFVRSTSNASALTSLCADLSPSDSHFFEVLYIGKVRISQRKVPETLIDDALKKFKIYESEKTLKRRHSLLSSTGSSLDSTTSTEYEIQEQNNVSNESFTNKFSTPSTTPLEPDKGTAWKSVESLFEVSKESKQVDVEFDIFTKERVDKVKKCSLTDSPIPILSLPKNNLGTVEEDEEKADLNSNIQENVSSATQLNQTSYLNGANSVEFQSDLKNENTKTDHGKIGPKTVSFNCEEIPRRSSIKIDQIESNIMPANRQFLRERSASIGTIVTKTPMAHLTGEQNRTMLFQVGRSELRLISPDRKQILLHRSFKDVASCVLGRANVDHFGFVCRETNDTYACYVFKCESDSVAGEVINAIRQAFMAHAEMLKRSREKSPNMTCEHCPMLWYHRLCHDIEGMSDKKTHAFILRRLEQLPDDEQDTIITKYQGGTNHMYETSEHNSFLMMLLRAHCEAKQLRHVHDTAENRSEFLNQYLGGSTIFMKAKRSLSSGFDHLLKRKSSKDDGILIPHLKKDTSPLPAAVVKSESSDALAPENSRSKSVSPGVGETENGSPPRDSSIVTESKEVSEGKEDIGVNSPMMDIFLKVSDSRSGPTDADAEIEFTWRQAIYEKAIKSTDSQNKVPRKRSKDELRLLWKMAINQIIILVRMERENARLRESEESSAVRRIKLEYSELGTCDAGVSLMWDSLLSRDKSQPVGKVDKHMLTQAVIQGVPRMSRGAIWYFLAEQACLRSPPPDTRCYPLYHTPYKSLLGGLTKHHHAILIDLGRTFPKHSYFSSALGPGQLALYNILKGYSLLDPDVGYCQGLSFVAGVLLLHMDEAEAFVLLRHLMFRRGLRYQYLPDMSALQVQLYQLSRLLRDHEPDLHAKLEALEISPALYATPWMLTLFTSQFPLGLVVRVFDLIFLESLDVVFSVSLALLSVHKDGLMMCESCEEAAEYLKHKLPDMDRIVYEKVMKKVTSVHTLDMSRQLSDYAVEYAVLREEMPRVASLTEQNKKLKLDNRKMGDQLDSAMDALNNYQKNQARLENVNRNMEQQLMFLSRYISATNRGELPPDIKTIIQNYSKKQSLSSKLFSSKYTSEEDPKKNFKQGLSTPNLFSKMSKDIQNVKTPQENEKRFVMKKSQSVHSGLTVHYPLKVLEEKDEIKKIKDAEYLSESLKDGGKKGFFASTHEQIRQERLFERQLKQDFDENLRRLDEKLNQKACVDDSIFHNKKSMSLNLPNKNEPASRKPDGIPSLNVDDRKDDTSSVISHPLSDCDVDIKFDGQSTKLKQIRPLRHAEKN